MATTEEQIIDYVLKTPGNTNPQILRQLLEEQRGTTNYNELENKPLIYDDIRDLYTAAQRRIIEAHLKSLGVPVEDEDVVNKKYLDEAINDIVSLEYQIVDSLPQTGEKGIIYLVAKDEGTYDEYIWIEDKFEKIGATDIDLAGYLELSGGTMTGTLDMNDNSITNIPEPTRDSDAANKEYVDRHNPDTQKQGNWSYKVFPDGTFEAWYKATDQRMEILEQSGNTYRSALQTMTLPTNLTDGKTCEIIDCYVNCGHNNYPVWGVIASIQAPGYPYSVNWYAISGNYRSLARNYYITCFIMGTIT